MKFLMTLIIKLMFLRIVNQGAKNLRAVPRRSHARKLEENLPEKREQKVPKSISGVQFSKQALRDFGELPRGEIPIALESSPESHMTSLNNGVRVVSETYSVPTATITVTVKAGSRFETIGSSGACHFVSQMIYRGPDSLSFEEYQKKAHSLGMEIEVTLGRELVHYTIKVLAEDAQEATALMLESILRPSFDANQIEADKEAIHRRIIDVSRDQYEQSKEGLFYTAFRDHMMGQSQYGARDNIPALNQSIIQEFHRKHFVGENIVVVVSGHVQHNEIAEAVSGATKDISPKFSGYYENEEKPLLTPSVMTQRDDEMANVNISVGLIAPPYGHPDYFGMKIFEKIIGDYNAAKHGSAHLNSAVRQYNYMHRSLGYMSGVSLQHTEYIGFSDVGLMTGYLHGHDFWGREMMYYNQHMLSGYAHNLNQVEVFRARAELFNELLIRGPSKALNEEAAKEIFYIGRRLSRTELAYRYSHLSGQKDLQQFAFNWFYDKELALSIWGPCHNFMANAYYDRRIMTSTKADITNLI